MRISFFWDLFFLEDGHSNFFRNVINHTTLRHILEGIDFQVYISFYHTCNACSKGQRQAVTWLLHQRSRELAATDADSEKVL